ncbi:TetR/AcrR family transcriptional regulator [Peribacillus frigoritolerans]|uniref:TetR/AcrR family transcriptional regulator n=1 Tax=Peribacillus frigoritolerans TaxID=450367 RepID=UPI001925DFAA|nr:TetR/AcrR family transcriptional regulator [Peribacillus frigoritolerans]MBL3645867.1 TetR/AcrR family transcriptional regulator [Bacillus sp. RHFB]MCK2005281.1 TetR/AcrR family transcriptional regulator [Peribacillus frigoritolerans]MED3790321.1 TetR/AcrR family transcriptional regulator [Peribacillus frigoritolerans]
MKRQELIDAALLHYSLHGYQGATMKKIADEVGIKPASIYFFYKNKEELFIAAFQHLLDNHLAEMKRILAETSSRSVDRIFSEMLHGIVKYHKDDEQGTMAYISLVTSPIPEIKLYLQKYLLHFNDWMVSSLEDLLRQSYPSLSTDEVDQIIKQFVLLGNGLFWGINLYEGQDLMEQVQIADRFISSMFRDIERKYGPLSKSE